MKTIKLSILLLLIVSMVSSCRTIKTVTPKEEGEVLLQSFCNDYETDKKTFRYSAVGESMDLMISQNKAESECRKGLSAQINTFVKGVTDNYVKSGNYSDKEESMKNYEGITREIVNQSLSGTKVICKKQTRTKSGSIKTYMCMELDREQLKTLIDNNKMLKIDYNYEKFKKTFEEEMSKLDKNSK